MTLKILAVSLFAFAASHSVCAAINPNDLIQARQCNRLLVARVDEAVQAKIKDQVVRLLDSLFYQTGTEFSLVVDGAKPVGEFRLTKRQGLLLKQAIASGLLNNPNIHFKFLSDGHVIIFNRNKVQEILGDQKKMSFLREAQQELKTVDEVIDRFSRELGDVATGIFFGFPLESVRSYRAHNEAIDLGKASPVRGTHIYLDLRDGIVRVYTPTAKDFEGGRKSGALREDSPLLQDYFMDLWSFGRPGDEITPDIIELVNRSQKMIVRSVKFNDAHRDSIRMFNGWPAR